MALCALMLFILSPFETGPHYNIIQIMMFFGVGGVGLSVTGLGMWVIACIIAFFGRQLKNDGRSDKLFD